MEQCRQAVMHSLKYQQVLVHQLDLQTSVVNRTREEVVSNRAKIENLASWLLNIVLPKVNELPAIMNDTLHRLS